MDETPYKPVKMYPKRGNFAVLRILSHKGLTISKTDLDKMFQLLSLAIIILTKIYFLFFYLFYYLLILARVFYYFYVKRGKVFNNGVPWC